MTTKGKSSRLGVIGKKLGMTQVFDEQGLAIPVTPRRLTDITQFRLALNLLRKNTLLRLKSDILRKTDSITSDICRNLESKIPTNIK